MESKRDNPFVTASHQNFPGQHRRFQQAGVSFIELVIFILVVGIAVSSILSVMSTTVSRSADPQVRKQAIAVAEGLLEEVEFHAFTWCDPDDSANLKTAASTASCTVPETLGAETSETRYAVPLFDNVNDYNGFSMSGIRSVNDSATVVLSEFNATVTITQVGTSFGLADNTAALRIDVQITGKENFTLTGYRFRHSPNSGG